MPTAKAILGGGYSAKVNDNKVSSEGWQILVERILQAINRMWEA
ncbi:MAG: hypothetical protein PHW60_08015 [Kiritimatiellae bacterium]|nr:hypothetical protein [Kiritimatiellia bacterium]